jgi:ABC-2 type transport system ATP-binding protein
MHVIETVALSKIFLARPAVADLDLQVQAGEIYGFLGPNGAGKTTTIRMLTGLLPPSRGQARVAGYDLRTHPDDVRACIGLLPESIGYYGWMTAVEYLGFFADLYGVRPPEARERIRALLQRVGLADRQQTRIATFSRGMRARLGLARVLVHRPRVVFLDEPTLGLDPLGQRDVLELIQHVNREEGTTVFLSSHALDQVGHLCSRIGILHEGRLIAQGTTAELAHRLTLPYTVRVTVTDMARAEHVAKGLGVYATLSVLDEACLALTPKTDEAHTAMLVQALVKAGVGVREVLVNTPTLEDVFFALVRQVRSTA